MHTLFRAQVVLMQTYFNTPTYYKYTECVLHITLNENLHCVRASGRRKTQDKGKEKGLKDCYNTLENNSERSVVIFIFIFLHPVVIYLKYIIL